MGYSFTPADERQSLSQPHWVNERENSKPRRLRFGPILAVSAMQAFLFLAHWFIYHTWMSFWPLSPEPALDLRIALFLLSTSFVVAALLGFHYTNRFVSLIYKVAAVWLGLLNFIFWAACLCWAANLGLRLAASGAESAGRPWIAAALFGLAFLAAIYGMINARQIRERRVTVELPNLAPSWRGRTALLVSDMHLGNINGAGFARRIANIARRLNPAVVLIAGDLFDGSKADADSLAAPFFELSKSVGIYFCNGNHEAIGDAAEYSASLIRGGIRVLHNERVDLDGLQVVGVSYSDTNYPVRLRTFLDSLNLADGPASVLLNHVPHRLTIVEQAGVSLQLSGHTHGGQVVPFTWITRRIFGKFTHGLQRFGKLQVYTSTGAGTWGPPMRLGSEPEVVLITFA
jgi:predicted MPP superfamily phosphohydrolase